MSANTSESLLYDGISTQLKGDRRIQDLAKRYRLRALPIRLSGPKPGFSAFLIARTMRDSRRKTAVIVPNEIEAQNLQRDFELFGVTSEIFGWFGTTPYSASSHTGPVQGKRIQALHHFDLEETDVLIIPVRSAVSFLPESEQLLKSRIHITPGQTVDTVKLAEDLVSFGYWRVPKVTVHGEFAVRGEVIDIFGTGSNEPIRILLNFDVVSEIREFEVFSQQTVTRLGATTVLPVAITPDESGIRSMLDELSRTDEFRHVQKDLDAMTAPPLYWIPTLTGNLRTVFDVLPPDTGFFWLDTERIGNAFEQYRKEVLAMYEAERFSRALPLPQKILADLDELLALLRPRSVMIEALLNSEDQEVVRFQCDPARSYFGNVSFLKEELSTLSAMGYTIYVFADTDSQKKRIEHLLSEFPSIIVRSQRISGGFTLPEAKVTVIQENEIFGRRRRAPVSVQRVESSPIDTFIELEEGDPVVHVNYGIGLFRGITRMRAGGNERDYIKIEYAGEEIVFVPIEQVNLIQRYIGSGGSLPRLDTIGGKSWERRKSTVRRNVEDLAERLVRLYSRRQKAQGFGFPRDTEWQIEFESAFPYDETPDQLRCIQEIKTDMEQPVPMDRLVCGDVGYGKTEVALRSAFKAVMAGKQVAILAPTTILVEQHFETIQDRFNPFPIRTAMLSRFVNKQTQKDVLKRLSSGEVDLVVGTHRLLQRDVKFKDLGLLVIDEEQRFGVKSKEILKEFKTTIDCLTLTATPIPRTLHMSLLKIRDMSLLTTPPRNRHPIETTIAEFNEETIAGAVRREIERGGQVFFLHNRVETLENVRLFIESIVPEVLVDTAHGQMSATQLEEVMHRFIHGAFQVLVATTIIENGIDIPNVNTIIIDRADMYGISQLYQLRGRVGRSDRVAYAYLFYPEERALSEIAMKRLQIISDFTELGSGFKIALKDLEVRGAGNLLGHQQSGDILSVGFDMYLRLLDEAVRSFNDGDGGVDEEVYLELEYSGFIPDTYISDMMEKMEVYKKIAAVSDDTELETLIAETEDRFGPMPPELHSLLTLAELRIMARTLHISSLRERSGLVRIEFSRVAGISVERVLALISSSGGSVRLDPNAPNVLMIETGKIGLKEKSEFIRGRVSQLL